MRIMINRLLVIGLVLGGLLARAQSGGRFEIDKIVARVDNYIVLKSDLDGAYQTYLMGGNEPSQQAKCTLLNRLVMEKMMVAKAHIDSVTVGDAEVDANTENRIQMILQNTGNSPGELEKAYGKTMEEIKLDLRDRIREQMLSSKMMSTITGEMTITPLEVRQFFKKMNPDSLPFYSSSVEVAQIVRVIQASKEQKDQVRNLLIGLRDRVLAGESFNELAKLYSQDPSVMQNSGEMGYVGRGSMVSEYEAAAFRLKIGEISMPFESPYGLHILQLLDRRGSEYNSRHILITVSPSPRDIESARLFLDSLRREIVQNHMAFSAAARLYSEDQATKGQGGFFSSPEGDNEVSVRDLDPSVYFAVDTMKVSSITPPMEYRTQDGKQAVRILFFKSKTHPHRANLKEDWHRIQTAAIAEKKDTALNKWFEKARRDVFIRVAPEYGFCHIAV